MEPIDEVENEKRMLRGELYYAFLPNLIAKRNRCHHACHRFNIEGEASRRKLVELWREYEIMFTFLFEIPNITYSIVDDKSPIPPPGKTEDEDAVILKDEPYIDGPIKVDYGTNLRYLANPKSL